jgi:hypothetical protein
VALSAVLSRQRPNDESHLALLPVLRALMHDAMNRNVPLLTHTVISILAEAGRFANDSRRELVFLSLSSLWYSPSQAVP